MITLKTLPQATAQQVFDQGVRHLLTQGKKSTTITEDGARICAYHNQDGTRCAAGCFISEDEYDSTIEGESWLGLSTHCSKIPDNHNGIIDRLQDTHDHWEVSQWPQRLFSLAFIFNLDDSVIREFGHVPFFDEDSE
jgi:hypothetical protein